MRLHHMKHHQGYVNALDALRPVMSKLRHASPSKPFSSPTVVLNVGLGDVRVHAHFYTRRLARTISSPSPGVIVRLFASRFGLLSSIRITDVRSDCL
ncbi:hypothetical protein L210DRAFT_3570302 [Boletus edulis BED1]|uniref:Superoxide dismutase n=1 Tax=Boletus edulis BED1 TaxID=1328754 RepID=A0AAD4BEA9_BOLED|nr:hypothetical protein L210DRAFT_3570302 [Boletus edulis BED1]